MKKIVLSALFVSALIPAHGFAADGKNDSLPPPVPSGLLQMPQFLGEDNVVLTPKERQALNLNRSWTSRGPAPMLSRDGKLTYVHGSSMPSIIASPFQICDVELQPGERINEIVVGDSARWMVESGTAGNTAHIFIKPVDVGLETTAVITTDRRVYHLRLRSKEQDHTPYVGFVYSDDLKRTIRTHNQAKLDEEQRRVGDMGDGRPVDISGLNFGYKLNGKASWRPERVFDDGKKIYIYLPAKTTEMPVLLARKNGQNVMVNYRADGRQLVVDGIFDELSLLLGVGSKREEIKIERR